MAGEQWAGGMLVTTAALIALQISQGRSQEELELLAAFFTVLGDNLALIAGQVPTNTTSTIENTCNNDNTKTPTTERATGETSS